MLAVNSRIRIPCSEFQFQVSRSSGPGGQNVNKVNSKVTLRWNVAESPSIPQDVRSRLLVKYSGRITAAGELLVSSDQFREQPRNKAACLGRLRETLQAVAQVPKQRKPTKPSKSKREARLLSKKKRSALKHSRRSKWED